MSHDPVPPPDNDDGCLRCAWCGERLNALEFIEHRSIPRAERWGWHLDCYEKDTMTNTRLSWTWRRDKIVRRGPHRIGKVDCDND